MPEKWPAKPRSLAGHTYGFLDRIKDPPEDRRIHGFDNYAYYSDDIDYDLKKIKIFTIDIIEGDPLKNFNEPLKVILSEKTAEIFFGKRSPLGKRLKIFNSWDVEVTGVFKNFPDQSFWHPDMFVSFSIV